MKTKDELLNAFKKEMTEANAYSKTGLILSDPITIKGTSKPVERSAVEDFIKENGLNPFTLEPMTLTDLDLILSDHYFKEKIEDKIQVFLENIKGHPDFKEIEQAINNQRYDPFRSESAVEAETSEKEQESFLNLWSTETNSSNSSSSFFEKQLPKWAFNEEWLLLPNTHQDMTKAKYYRNQTPNCLIAINLYEFHDNTYAIELHTNDSKLHNQMLIQALEIKGFSKTSPSVITFPSVDNDPNIIHCCFELRASLNIMMTTLPYILAVVENLEGKASADIIRSNITNSFRMLLPTFSQQ